MDKRPAVENGVYAATTDVAQINAWWSENPDYNVATSPETSGLCVIDTDPPVGEDTWTDLQIEHGEAPPTKMVRTPRGGHHRYYAGSLPPSVQKLGLKVDTRGVGSYVLLPPSRTPDGTYSYLADLPPAPLPAWVAPIVTRAREKAKASTEVLDHPANVSRATSYLKSATPAREGEGGDERTYVVCCEVLNLGISPELAHDLIMEHWAVRCEPFDAEFMDGFIRTKLENASAYAQNEPGAWAVEPAQEVFGDALGKLLSEAAPARRSKFHPYTLAEMRALPPLEWLLPDLVVERSLAMLYGPPGSYKSFIALDMAMTVATGVAAYGREAQPPRDVVYLAGEGFRGMELRASAWCLAHGVEETRLRIMPNVPEVLVEDDAVEFMEQLLAAGLHPALIVADTASKAMMGMNENDARDANVFVKALQAMSEATGAAVLVIHHTGHEGGRARGSSALPGGFDTMAEVEGDDVTKTVKMSCVKVKDGERRQAPWFFEGKKLASNLVFQPITAADHRALVHVDDGLNPKVIGAALSALKARGAEAGVTSTVLAAQMLPPAHDVSPEVAQEQITRLAGILARKASGGPLEAYATGKGAALRWYLPA